MLPPLTSGLAPNSPDFERAALIAPAGFREYDARWRYPEQINLPGAQLLGAGLGTLLHELGVTPQIVVGHDYRSYSLAIKQALTLGLMAAGCEVHDIGLAVSPMAYFAQFALDVPAVAMVTASHNDNGWTGVKMGANRPLTFGPEEMARLRDIVLQDGAQLRDGGRYRFVGDMAARYVDDLVGAKRLSRPLKVVAACGNGTAGLFAQPVLERLGAEVIPLHCELDYTFPHYNPNPEHLHMLHDMRDQVLAHGADVAFGFDGDGDRCGVVDNQGHEIFADKIGVMLARDLSDIHDGGLFVADVKSTGLYMSDPYLQERGVRTDYWKTGHSYIKSRVQEIGALAGFEKSGHFFFNAPIGRGYDDGLLSAIAICELLDRNPDKSLNDLYRALPRTHSSPTMSPFCADEHKYNVVDKIRAHYEGCAERGETVLGERIADLVTVNGIRVVLEDGTWGLVRASSNIPALVVVVESPVSEAQMRAMFGEIDRLLEAIPEVGDYDQRL